MGIDVHLPVFCVHTLRVAATRLAGWCIHRLFGVHLRAAGLGHLLALWGCFAGLLATILHTTELPNRCVRLTRPNAAVCCCSTGNVAKRTENRPIGQQLYGLRNKGKLQGLVKVNRLRLRQRASLSAPGCPSSPAQLRPEADRAVFPALCAFTHWLAFPVSTWSKLGLGGCCSIPSTAVAPPALLDLLCASDTA